MESFMKGTQYPVPIKAETAQAQEMLSRTNTDGVGFYSEWCQNYDKDMNSMGYNGPDICASLIAKHLGDNKDARIIDICAGTGKLAEGLVRLGFANVDAVDANKSMLDLARQKNVYKNIFHQYISATTETPELETDGYDGAVASGTFYRGGLQAACLKELIRVVKPGGFIVIVTWIDGGREDIDTELEKHVDAGAITVVERVLTESYILGGRGEGIIVQIV